MPKANEISDMTVMSNHLIRNLLIISNDDDDDDKITCP